MRHAVIIAGGAGTRLWPMSRNELPKQLIPFIRGRSLLSHSYARLEGLVEVERRHVCAGEALRGAILGELPQLAAERYIAEPVGRDTLAALGYSAAVISRIDPDAVIGVFTADHLIEPEDRFRRIVAEGFRVAEESPETLVTFGIAPTHPSTGYGYLKLGDGFLHGSLIVSQFEEKPDLQTAQRYVAEGPRRYLWNSGMFVWKASTFLDCLRRYQPDVFPGLSRLADAWGTPRLSSLIAEVYPTLKKISVDYAVMEPASRDPLVKVAAVPMQLSWLDIGSWPAFAGTIAADARGNAVSAETSALLDTNGTLVASSDPHHLLAAIGCQDMIIVHTPDATLVCRKDSAEDIKKLHALIAERFGGKYL